MKEITSASNSDYKLFMKLISAKKYRRQAKAYLAEGLNVLDIPRHKIRTYLLPISLKHKIKEWELSPDQVVLLADGLFKALSVDPASQGLIGLVAMEENHWQPEAWPQLEQALYLALEGIQDPGNLGTIIRTGEAAGVKAIFCSETTVDLYHPKVVKAAASSLSRMRLVTGVNLLDLVALAKESGIPSFATSPLGAKPYSQVSYQGGGVVLIGNEGQGLSQDLLQAADQRIYIPMSGQIESLNAGISAGIILFEAKKDIAPRKKDK